MRMTPLALRTVKAGLSQLEAHLRAIEDSGLPSPPPDEIESLHQDYRALEVLLGHHKASSVTAARAT